MKKITLAMLLIAPGLTLGKGTANTGGVEAEQLQKAAAAVHETKPETENQAPQNLKASSQAKPTGNTEAK